jgi:hypothetical protein
MSTPHVIASSSSHPPSSTTSNGIVGNHYRVGKKIGEGSFGVVFEGAFLFTFGSVSVLLETGSKYGPPSGSLSLVRSWRAPHRTRSSELHIIDSTRSPVASSVHRGRFWPLHGG